jgi:hypothetical protein
MIGSRCDRDQDGMVLIAEHVHDAFTTHVLHDDSNALVVGGGMGDVPCFGGMIAQRFAPAELLVNQDLCAERCHRCGIKQIGPFLHFMSGQ